jgi:hypothetical protein
MINRRADPRQAVTLKALVHPERGRSWLCTIRDFCQGGMLLMSEGARSLEASGSNPKREDGIQVHFTVPTVDGDRHFRLQAFVARVTADGDGLGVFYPDGMDALALKSLDEYAAATGGGLKREETARGPRTGEFRINARDAADVLGDVKDIASRGLPRVTRTFFEAAEKDLLVRARDASRSDDQTRFFNAMNELERCRKEVDIAFVRAIMERLRRNSRRGSRSPRSSPRSRRVSSTSCWICVSGLD